MSNNIYILIIAASLMFVVIGGLSILSHYYTLNGIKSRTVGDGQHGTARFATKREIQKTYSRVLFTPQEWREGMNCPDLQGVVLGCVGHKNKLKALVDT
ncbi:MAG: type IV secretory system conjugative DNA transfer family protein, partial [Oscillospiraceae bacterium]